MDWALSYIPAWNSYIAIMLFWVPMVVCFVGYSFRGLAAIRTDLVNRKSYLNHETNHYEPKATFGAFLWALFVSILPVGNLIATLFDVGKEVISEILNFPLIPKPVSRPPAPERATRDEDGPVSSPRYYGEPRR